MSTIKWYLVYRPDGTLFRAEEENGNSNRVGVNQFGYTRVLWTPPPIPEPEITDGVYWVEDEQGDSGILLKHKGQWTDTDFFSMDEPYKIIEKLSK